MNESPHSERLAHRRDVWSRYWRHGAAHSCQGSFGDRYQGSIGAWWRAVFEPLQSPVRLLDLATGSGAVLRLAVEQCRHEKSTFHGADLGLTESSWFGSQVVGGNSRVHFHPGVRNEALPFDDASFDLITSQYGLEYSDLDRATAELRRVLKPAGAVRLVLHHADAVAARLARTELELMAWLKQPSGLLEVAQGMFEPLSRAGTAAGRASLQHDRHANQLRRLFNSLQDERHSLAATSACPDVLHEASDAIGQSFSLAQNSGLDVTHTHWTEYRQELDDSQFRLQELVACALQPSALFALAARLEALGLRVSSGELTDGAHLMGWWLKADPG